MKMRLDVETSKEKQARVRIENRENFESLLRQTRNKKPSDEKLEFEKPYNQTMIDLDLDAEDTIQTRMLYLLENAEKLQKYQSEGHFASSLRWYVRKRQIRIHQTRENMVSLNDNETGEEYFVSVPRDFTLYRYILTHKQADGKWTFSKLQMKVLAKRFLGEKTEREIADEMGKSKTAIHHACKAIDSKILRMDIQGNKGPWYHGEGNNLPMSQVWDTSSRYDEGEANSKARIYTPNGKRPTVHKGKIPTPHKSSKVKRDYNQLIKTIMDQDHVKRTSIMMHNRYNVDRSSDLMIA
jgi:hypothetical protein